MTGIKGWKLYVLAIALAIAAAMAAALAASG